MLKGKMTCSLWLIVGVLVMRTMGISSSKVGPANQNDLATRMFDISKGLDVQLADIMSTQGVNFTYVNATGPYNATAKFNPKGMGQLYNVTNKFIDFIQSKQAFPQGLITVNNGALQYADPAKEWKSIVIHYGGLAGLAIAGLLVAAVIPCVGLFFCCCRCAGHCGARSQPFDKKHDHCRKVFLSIILIGVATIILFGVVCAFVTNEYMQQNTENWPTKAKISLKDVELYLSITKKQINTLLINNYNELELNLKEILEMSGETVTERLEEYSHAVSLTSLDNIVSGLDNITSELRMMDKITNDLRTNASQLDISVRGVKRDLLHTLASCKSPQCQQVINDYKVNEMAVQVEFNKLPNVTDALRNITSLMDENIVKEVKQGKESFMKIQRDIQQAVNQTIPVVSSSIRNAGRSLSGISNNISDLIDKINRNIIKDYIPYLKIAQEKIDHYSIYRYYLGLGVSGVLLLILVCLTFGLLCGICGKRPDGYGDDCCNKGSGARFLMMAVWIIFLLMSVLMAVTTVLMLTGVMASRVVCEPLKNPNNNLAFKLVDDLVKIKDRLYRNDPDADINLNWIVTKCHANETIYKVSKFHHSIDLESIRDYIDKYSISSTIDQLSKKINLSPGIVILSESATSKLNDLAQSGLSDIKFYQYAELLKDNITSINLENLGIKLRQIANQIPNEQEEIRESLLKNAHDLQHYHRDLVTPMTVLSEQLSASALQLQEHIKFNHGSMTEAIHKLVDEVMAAQKFLNEDGPETVRILATKFGDAFLERIKDFLEHIITNARDKIGKCGPVSNAYNATVVAACNGIVDPYNGFWISVGWCLILFIPTIVLCVKLSALYQKSDPYPGPLVESEYLYDAYADRDNIPLSAHAHDKKQGAHSRHHPHAYAETYDGPAVSATYTGRERVADAHQGSSNDTRYSDMSNKNWDFPNGGPPRYQPAPGAPPLSTEYERPPPYYYPGPVACTKAALDNVAIHSLTRSYKRKTGNKKKNVNNKRDYV